MDKRNDVRNIAIIAHVDHGKTTLVDQILRQSGLFRENEQVQERVMDSNDLERERGITILAKTTAVHYKDVKINIVDTPGHADFGGEVERILLMVDGVLLLVDAFEGCMPQTRFVLKKALQVGKRPIVVLNKIDRPDIRPEEVIDQLLEVFIELGADGDFLDFPIICASGRAGTSGLYGEPMQQDLRPLLDAILEHVPAPEGDANGPLQLLFSNIEHDEYVGRIGIGRVERGSFMRGQRAVLCHRDGSQEEVQLTRIYQYEGLKRVETEAAALGDIVAVAGMPDLNIGETVCAADCIEPLPFVNIDEPTIAMNFMVNDSPFAGREGKYVTSRNLRDRLFKEIETNVSLRVEETGSPDCFKVAGRGELHLSILIETMRRQDYEFQVSRPQVLYREIDGMRHEPIEWLTVDVPDEYVGVVMEKLSARKGTLENMTIDGRGNTRLEFTIPSRGLMGYRSEFLTDTKGLGIMNSIFHGYEPYKGDLPGRTRGSMIAFETGESNAYGLFNAQGRGDLFIGPGLPVYAGMIVGESAKPQDLPINVCKKKHMSNMRAAGSEEALRLSPPRQLSLEQALEFIADDELVEVTPKSIRLRKLPNGKERWVGK